MKACSMITQQDIEQLFDRQMTAWPEAAQRIRDLQERVQRRQVGPYVVQFNPARAVSTMARVDKASLQERPCFLCAHNRPSVQEGLQVLGGRWEVLINPFPILERHLTIVCCQHTPQRLTRQDLSDMVALSRMLPDYTVFYNGARCGASAPDHKHLQAGKGAPVPLPMWGRALLNEEELWDAISRLPMEEGREEPDFNLLVTNGRGYVIPRRQHRPQCYHDGTCLVSPGALDMAGLIITPREEDYRSLTEERITRILEECGGHTSPVVSVGIMEAPEVHYTQHREGFTLHGVTIGKEFHWQRLQDQSFRGRLRIVANPATGMQQAINDVAVEDYLLSVISSEMSSTSSLELLKAHAVISRSWVLRMKQRAVETSAASRAAQPLHTEGEHIRWYDTSAHDLFDVCADDHCQRYQGVAGVNPVVERAIRETTGEVLCDSNGALCDTRFSKCCGGRTERYSACWEDQDYDYLQPVDCPYCNTQDAHLLRQVLNTYDQETHDFHDWEVRYSQEELSRLAERKLHLGLGTILDLQPVERGASGRIIRLRVVGSERSLIVGKELEIRKLLSPTHLYSSAFDVERDGADFILCGHGWGHGAGLCQIGAAVMASEGYDYRQILAHYYPTSHIQNNYAQ